MRMVVLFGRDRVSKCGWRRGRGAVDAVSSWGSGCTRREIIFAVPSVGEAWDLPYPLEMGGSTGYLRSLLLGDEGWTAGEVSSLWVFYATQGQSAWDALSAEEVVMGLISTFLSKFKKPAEPTTTDTARLDDGMMAGSSLVGQVHGYVAKEMLDYLRGSSNRLKLYRDYKEMERRHPMVGVALDMYADYSINGGEAEAQNTFRVRMSDDKAQGVVDLALKRSKLRDHAWSLVRGMCQMGDQFVELVLDKRGLTRVKGVPCGQMYRIEDEYGRLQHYIQQVSSGEDLDLEPLQVVHWRLMANIEDLYGRSVLYSGLRAARELGLVEDSATLARLTKGVMRYKWLVDVGKNTDPDKQKMLLERAKVANRHELYMNPDGTMGGNMNILRAVEDIYVPVMGTDGKADVEVLPGDKGVGNVSDLQHKRDAVFMSLRFPKSWYGLHGGSLTRADVDQSSINAFRAVRRVRNAFSGGLHQFIVVALIGSGYTCSQALGLAEEAIITYPNITHSDVLLKAQIDKTRLEVAKMYKELGLLGRKDLLVKILGYSEQEADAALRAAEEDAEVMKAAGLEPTPPAGAKQEADLELDPELFAREVVEKLEASETVSDMILGVRELTELVNLSH